ncbi:MAG: hypothetical protein ACRDMI_16320 [Streptosporangiaceae bacterium]
MNSENNQPDHDAPSVAALQSRRAELDTLAAQHPDHRIWTETLPGLPRRYLAQRRPGTSARPYLIMTGDLDELKAALPTPSAQPSPSRDQTP